MKDIRESAGIVRSLARQYQAVIDLAENVGDGVKLEQQTVEAQDRLRVEEGKLSNINRQIEEARKSLSDVEADITKRQAEMVKVQTAQSEAYTAGGIKSKELEASIKRSENALKQANHKVDAAEAQLLDLQGTINDKKKELSRIQAKINEVQAALAKVA